jgi:hypothetical protein
VVAGSVCILLCAVVVQNVSSWSNIPQVSTIEIASNKESKFSEVPLSLINQNVLNLPVPSSLPPRLWAFPSTVTETNPRWIPSTHDFNDFHIAISSYPSALHRVEQLFPLWTVPNLSISVYWSHWDDDEAYSMQNPKTLSSQQQIWFERLKLIPQIIFSGTLESMALHEKWFRMASSAVQHAPSSTRWFILADDDTIWFPRVLMGALKALEAQYGDPLKDMIYAGDVSELPHQTAWLGQMAFGGGGAILSRALALELVKLIPSCSRRFEMESIGGDARLARCIALVRPTNPVPFIRLPVLNQLDLWHARNPQAYLSSRFSRAPPASLHHVNFLPPILPANNPLELLNFLSRNIPTALQYRRIHFRASSQWPACKAHASDCSVFFTFGFALRVYHGKVDSTYPVDDDSGSGVGADIDAFMNGTPRLSPSAPLMEFEHDKVATYRIPFQDYYLTTWDYRGMIYLDQGTQETIQISCQDSSRELGLWCAP